jgi:FkbM family methyltransferase
MNSISRRLSVLKNSGVDISHFLDIGAYRGEFTRIVKNYWPEARVWQIEADERQQPWLYSDAIFALLSDRSNQELDFFTLHNENSITTGSSVYRALTQYYKNPIVIKKRTTTLDDISKRVNFRGNWKNSGLVKLDTQGSELDILRGAENFLTIYQPKYILIETSVKPYNLEAPLVGDVIEYMRSKDYQILDIMHCMYDSNEFLLQIDILFNKI